MLPLQATGRLPLIGFYALYFSITGIVLPFLPAYLKSLTLSVSQVGLLLSLSPLLSLGAPHFWGHLADRTGRPNRVLNLVCCGACVGFIPLIFVDRFPTLVVSLAAYAFFASSISPLLDTLALQHIARTGGSYSHLRLFGSLGFVLSSTLFGLTVDSVDHATVVTALALLTALALWSFTLRDAGGPPAQVPVHPLAGLQLLADRELRWLLAACALHWIACAPYHGTFSIFVGSLGLPPSVVGLAMGFGVASEVLVMILYPRVANRISPRDLLAIAFVASTLRWAALSVTTSPALIAALSLLHGLSFGAFYVASIAFVARRVPPHLRASGQALFAAITFGVGGLVGYSSAGAGYDWLGGHRLFATAAVLELAAAALVLRITPEKPRLPA